MRYLILLFLFAVPASGAVFSLDACIAYALKHAPSLERSSLNYSNQVYRVDVAKTKFLPEFTVSDSYVEETDRNTLSASIDQTLPSDLNVRLSGSHQSDDEDEVVRYALRLSKVLLGGGSLLESTLPVKRAKVQEAQEWNSYSTERRRLRFDVIRSYYAVVRGVQTRSLRFLQLERAKRDLEHAELRQDPLDIANAKLRIPESELDVLRSNRSITNALYNLRETIGMPMAMPLAVESNFVYRVTRIDPEADLKRALAEHESIRNALLSVTLAEWDLEVAERQWGPEVSASLTVQDGDNFDETDTRGEISLSLPWGDRSDRLGARQAENNLRDRELALFEAEQSRSRSIRSLAMRVTESERAVSLQEQRVKVLEQQQELYQDRWDNGDINILEFIRSQNTLENARVQLVAQKTEYLELIAEYEFAVGR